MAEVFTKFEENHKAQIQKLSVSVGQQSIMYFSVQDFIDGIQIRV